MVTQCKKPDCSKPLHECIFDSNHLEYAIKCENLLKNFCDIEVYEARCHGDKPYPYTCWYASFKGILDEKVCFILHFDVRSSDIWIYFRFFDYVPKEMITDWAWAIRNKSIYIHYNNYTEKELVEIVNSYLEHIRPDYRTLNCRKRHADYTNRHTWIKHKKKRYEDLLHTKQNPVGYPIVWAAARDSER